MGGWGGCQRAAGVIFGCACVLYAFRLWTSVEGSIFEAKPLRTSKFNLERSSSSTVVVKVVHAACSASAGGALPLVTRGRTAAMLQRWRCWLLGAASPWR